jgi:hypothetical protein
MDDDLRQADLSHLSVKDMSPAQRAEMRRRFETFMQAFVPKPKPGEVKAPPKVRKWVPGMKK